MNAQDWEDELVERLETPPKPVGPPHVESGAVHRYAILASTSVDVYALVIPLHVTPDGAEEFSDTCTYFYYRVPACCQDAFLRWFDHFFPHLNLEEIDQP